MRRSRVRGRLAVGVALAVVGASGLVAWAPVAHAAGPTITSFTPAAGGVGTAVSLVGTGFTGATAVEFNGGNGTFANVTATTLTAVVPATASTGPITVVTPAGNAVSTTNFTVTPSISLTTPSATFTGSGGTAVVSGVAFGPYETVTATIGSVTVGASTTNGVGDFKFTITTPSGSTPGSTTVIVTGSTSKISASASLQIANSWLAPYATARSRDYQANESVLGPYNASELDLDWQDVTPYQSTGPAVVYGTTILTVGNNGVLTASTETTGAKLWTYTAPAADGLMGPVAVANGVAYAGTTKGYLIAIAAYANGAQYFAPVCVEAAGCTGSSPISTGVVAPTIANGYVYIPDGDGDLITALQSSGVVANRQVTGQDAGPVGPLVVQGAYSSWTLSNGYMIMDFNGQPQSVYSYGSTLSGVAGDDGYFYFVDGAATIICISYGSQFDITPSAGAADVLRPAIAGNELIVPVVTSADDPVLYYVNAFTGATLASAALEEFPESTPSVANGVVYVPESGGIVQAFNMSGDLLWTGGVGDYLGQYLTIANGQVLDTGSATLSSLDLNGQAQ